MEIETYNLTNPQKSILYTEQYFKGTTVNNICGTILIKEKIDFDKFIQAIHIVFRDNDNFKIRLTLNKKQEFVQYFSCDYILNTDIKLIQDMNELVELENKMVSIPFALVDSQLFNFQLFRFPDFSGGFVLNIHHLIGDACTANLIASKVATIYSALKKGENPSVPPASYLDYINSENEYINSEKYIKDKEYWEDSFKNIYDLATIPSTLDKNNISCKAIRKTFIFSETKVNLISNYCSKHKISVFNFFMALYAIYLQKVNNLKEFVIGTPILNRSTFVEKNTPGMFISTMPFKFSIDNNFTFVDFAKSIAKDSLSMFRHQKYPYPNILEYIRSKNPLQPNLYDILISYQNTKTNCKTSDIPYEVRWTFSHNVADNMQIHLFDMNDMGILNIAYDYKIDKYSDTDIEYLHDRICFMIEQLLENEELLINDFSIVLPKEKDFILNKVNDTYFDYDKTKTVIDFFEEQVQNNPKKTALIFENSTFSYEELNLKANQLAIYLKNSGIKNKDIVGIMACRSPEMIIAILAILKIGAAYLPIDPEYPIDRINYMLSDSLAKTVLVHSATLNLSIGENYKKIDIDLNSDIYSTKTVKNINNAKPENLIYLIYTSGSTGKPKGVMITHQNITNFILGEKQYIDFSFDKVMVSVTTICFDIFALELWGALTSGMTLVLASDAEQLAPFKLKELCIKNHVNMIQTTPSRYNALFSDISEGDVFWKNFSDIMVGGEGFPKLLLQKLQKSTTANIFNMYGPTETTVWSTIKDLTKTDLITIGKPIANTTCYILDKNQNLLPLGVPGELYIGGDGVCNGYWKKAELTAEKFVKSKFNNNEIIYNTGDLAYIDYNGEIVHLGRTDFQVKIRGYRVELEEIQNKIISYPGIRDAVIIDKDNKYLICYYLAKKTCEEDKLTAYLLESLPYYMIPSYFIQIDSIPLTPNGKLNRFLLPDIEVSQKETEIPITVTQKNIANTIGKVLNQKKLDINSSFLDLGLDSLGIIKVQTMLLKFNYILTTQDFYKYPSIKKLAEKIDTNVTASQEQNAQVPLAFKHNMKDFKVVCNNANLQEDILGNVFLTGANGFVGIHILHELLNTTNQVIYCLVRGKDENHSLDRLNKAYKFYFDTEITPYVNSRIFIVSGNITSSYFGIDIDKFKQYINKFSTIIHTAAIVKHYGSFEDFEKININGTRNIAEFAYSYQKRLIHISSISVSGNYLVKQYNKDVDFSENSLYIGQHYTDNVYVNSKFEAEKIVLSYMEKGLNAQIHRIGILSSRYSDGVFQEKINENAFFNRIKSMVQIGAVTNKMLKQLIEFTPVDYCAKAIVLLAKSSICENKIYHLYNPNLISIKDLVCCFQNHDINVDILSEKQFDERLHNLSEESNSKLNSVINDITYNESNLLTLNYDYTVKLHCDYTQSYLALFNFYWPEIDNIYIDKLLKYMRKTNFI